MISGVYGGDVSDKAIATAGVLVLGGIVILATAAKEKTVEATKKYIRHKASFFSR